MSIGRVYVGSTLVAGGLVLPDNLSTLTYGTFSPQSNASAHAAGTWVEVSAALPAACKWLRVMAVGSNTSTSGGVSETLLEIGTGAAGAETVYATTSIGYHYATNTKHPLVDLPVNIAAGTRVAVRIRSVRLSLTVALDVWLGTHSAPATTPVTWGADTTASKGITIANPAGTGTPGAWTEIVASTSTAIQALHVAPQGITATMTAGAVSVEIGVGAASSEVTVGMLDLTYATQEIITVLTPRLLPVSIPAGSRIAARYTRSGTTQPLDLVVNGVPL